MTRRLNMSQCKRFINRTKVNRKACLAEAGKFNTSRTDSGSILIIQNNQVFTKDFTSCDP